MAFANSTPNDDPDVDAFGNTYREVLLRTNGCSGRRAFRVLAVTALSYFRSDVMYDHTSRDEHRYQNVKGAAGTLLFRQANIRLACADTSR